MASQILEQAMRRMVLDAGTASVSDMDDVPTDPMPIEFESSDMTVTLRMSVPEAKGLVDRLSKAIVSAGTRDSNPFPL